MPAKRKASSYGSRYKRARLTGTYNRGTQALANRLKKRVYNVNKTVVKRVNNLYKMIETKEITWKVESSTSAKSYFPHNNITLFGINPFQVSQGAADAMSEGNQVNRIGDQITVKGMMIRGFFENALERGKVFYRVMLLRCAKGDTPTRATMFKGNCNNKMIDQVNTERYSIVAQKSFNIMTSNFAPATAAGVTGLPTASPQLGGMGTRTFNMWIPGRKFGRGGNVQYENNSYQVKFYDYRIVVLAYDWFGTPQDENNVGFLNCLYTKVYFKDA